MRLINTKPIYSLKKLIPCTLVCKKYNLYFGIFPKHYFYYARSNLNSVQCSHEGMFIFPRCKSLTSKFFIEMYHNTILIICVDLIYCLLNVECYFRYFFQVTPKISFFSYENATCTRIFYCLAFHPSPCMLKYQYLKLLQNTGAPFKLNFSFSDDQ